MRCFYSFAKKIYIIYIIILFDKILKIFEIYIYIYIYIYIVSQISDFNFNDGFFWYSWH